MVAVGDKFFFMWRKIGAFGKIAVRQSEKMCIFAAAKER
jgi:hypothetical protein